MQRQQEKESKRGRRSLLEIVVSCFLLFWGAILNAYFFPPHNLIGGLCFLQGALSFLSGGFALLRLRTSARGALFAMALCLIGLAVEQLWAFRSIGISIILPLVLVFVGIAIGLMFLGRWIGQQED